MVLFLSAQAWASTCSVVLATREDYRPVSGELALPGEAGGWRKDAFAALPPSRRAQIEQYKKAFKRYPAAVQDELLRGELPDGLDEVAAVVAWGEPGFVWSSGRGCIGMLYGVDDGRPVALQACEGSLTERVELQRTVPCLWLAQGAERFDKRRKDLAAYDFTQQIEIIAGHRTDWMDSRAEQLAFGKSGSKAPGEPAILGAVVRAPEPAPVVAEPAPVVSEPVAEARSEAPPPAGQTSEPTPSEPVPPPVPEKPAQPAPVPVPSRARVDALPSVPIRPASVDLMVDCGQTWELHLEVADPFRATATARKPGGSVVRRTTQGNAQGFEDRVQLLGLGVYTYATRTVALGPWPDSACLGVEVQAKD